LLPGENRVRDPLRLVVSSELVFVVDAHNDRVIALDASTLDFVREVIEEPTKSQYFTRMSLTDDDSRMFLAHNSLARSVCLGGHVKAYNLTWS
jgi:hypothetical protein